VPGATNSNRGVSARTSVDKQTDYTHPRFWAPFILMGNWQ